MNHHYDDIRDKLGTPLWWDENAVPRYSEFSPSIVANIYAREIALLLIACQRCRHEFKVAISWPSMTDYLDGSPSLSSVRENGWLYYGDPPNIRCCPAGPTMTSDTLAVLQFWKKDEHYKWRKE